MCFTNNVNTGMLFLRYETVIPFSARFLSRKQRCFTFCLIGFTYSPDPFFTAKKIKFYLKPFCRNKNYRKFYIFRKWPKPIAKSPTFSNVSEIAKTHCEKSDFFQFFKMAEIHFNMWKIWKPEVTG